jgi:hypothetical protein
MATTTTRKRTVPATPAGAAVRAGRMRTANRATAAARARASGQGGTGGQQLPGQRRNPRPGQFYAAGRQGAQAVAGRGGAGLMAAFMFAVAIVALRALADYVPKDSGTSAGTEQPPSGQLGPLGILAGLIGTFFILSFLAAGGGARAKAAGVAGLIIDVVLLLNSLPELEVLSGHLASLKPGVPAASASGAGSTGVGATPSGGGILGTVRTTLSQSGGVSGIPALPAENAISDIIRGVEVVGGGIKRAVVNVDQAVIRGAVDFFEGKL